MAQAPWLLMIETDYVWMKPLQAPPAQDPASRGAAFPFGYITPSAPGLDGVMRKMYPPEMGPTADIPGTGPAPVMMRFAEWLEVGHLVLQRSVQGRVFVCSHRTGRVCPSQRLPPAALHALLSNRTSVNTCFKISTSSDEQLRDRFKYR